MTEFDHFLLKTEQVLEARKAAIALSAEPGKKVQPSKIDSRSFEQVTTLEWSKLLLAVTDQTSGRCINKDRFIAYGRTGVMLGKVILMLKPAAIEDKAVLKYFAEYRSSSSGGGVIKLAQVSIEPETSQNNSGGAQIRWKTAGLKENKPLATGELAMVLAMKLVDVYQANTTL